MTRTIPYVTAFVLVGTGRAQSPPQQVAIRGVIAADARLELVPGDVRGLEAPNIPDGGLYFSGVQANRTYKLDPNGNISVWRENGPVC